jgi:hypothetical protein
MKLNFIFTRDEETGCIGARAMLRDDNFWYQVEQLPCAIELDRKGNSDIIEYCSKDLTAEIIKACPTYRPELGLFTDVTEWDHLIPAVNLSVGYYNAHTNLEYLSIADYERINSYIPELNKIRGSYQLNPSGYDYNVDDYGTPYNLNYPDNGYHYPELEAGLVPCDYCGYDSDIMIKDSSGVHYCPDCFEAQSDYKIIYN